MSAKEETKAKLGRKASWYWVGVIVLYSMVFNKVTFEQRPEGTEEQASDITTGRASQAKGTASATGGNIFGVFEGSEEASVPRME